MRIIDLCCKAGGASMGLHQAFPKAEIIGVDIEPQPNYPFKFIQHDGLTFPLDGFDLGWASPPCQGYSECTPITTKSNHPKLIPQFRECFKAAGIPYIIENVEGARGDLINPLMLCGTMFGLMVWRHRYFETNPEIFWGPYNCNHKGHPVTINPASNARINQGPRNFQKEQIAMDIDWMNKKEIAQAIPPAYSKWIGEQLKEKHGI